MLDNEVALRQMEDNLACYQALLARFCGGAWTDRGSDLCASYLGIPHAMFNNVLRSRLDRAAIEKVVSRFEKHGCPWGWFVSATSAEATASWLEDIGFAKAFDLPNMVLPLEGLSIPNAPDSLRIERVSGPNGFKVFLQIVLDTFKDASSLGDTLAPVHNAIGYEANLSLQNFVGFAGEEPVSTSTVFLHDGVAGIYAVATREEARGRGYGAALTYQCIRWAVERGAHAVVLQASKMGLPVYRRMGFQEVGSSSAYILPSDPPH